MSYRERNQSGWQIASMGQSAKCLFHALFIEQVCGQDSSNVYGKVGSHFVQFQ